MIINATKNKVTILEREIISTGAFEAHTCEVLLSEDFDDTTNKVVFVTDDVIYDCSLQTTATKKYVTVPTFTKAGSVKVGVYGYTAESGTATLILSPEMAVFTVNEGSYTLDGESPIIPDVPTYEEILHQLSESMKCNTLPQGNINIKDLQPGFYAVKNTRNIKFYYGESSYLSFNISSIIIHDVVKDSLTYRFFIVNTLNKSYIGHSAIGSRGDLIYNYDCREFPKKSDKFEIVITESSGNYTKNKSFSEISEALNKNVEPYVLAYIHVLGTTVPMVLRYSAATESKIIFSTTITEKSDDEIQLETSSFILSSDESIEYYSKTL